MCLCQVFLFNSILYADTNTWNFYSLPLLLNYCFYWDVSVMPSYDRLVWFNHHLHWWICVTYNNTPYLSPFFVLIVIEDCYSDDCFVLVAVVPSVIIRCVISAKKEKTICLLWLLTQNSSWRILINDVFKKSYPMKHVQIIQKRKPKNLLAQDGFHVHYKG